MEVEVAAKMFAELGHKTRLELYRFLVRRGNHGTPVGAIQAELGVPASTLTHHIARLVSVGLIVQRREGRILYCVPKYQNLIQLTHFLMEQCCVDESCSENKSSDID